MPMSRRYAAHRAGTPPYAGAFYLVRFLVILSISKLVFFLPWAVVYKKLGWFGFGGDAHLHPDITGRLCLRVEERSIGME